jgi:hypothetical protein
MGCLALTCRAVRCPRAALQWPDAKQLPLRAPAAAYQELELSELFPRPARRQELGLIPAVSEARRASLLDLVYILAYLQAVASP